MRWGGPCGCLLAAIVFAVLATESASGQSTLTVWLLDYVLTPIRLLAFFGLGIMLAMIPDRACLVAALTALASLLVGLHLAQPLWAGLVALSPLRPHLYLLGPLACLAAGAALIAPPLLRPYLAPVSGLLFGLSLALVIHLTNPYLGAPGPSLWGSGSAIWMIASIAITASAWRQSWFRIAAPILGSWLLAIGLLSAGASVASSLKAAAESAAAVAAPAPAGEAQMNGFENLFPTAGQTGSEIPGNPQGDIPQQGRRQVLP